LKNIPDVPPQTWFLSPLHGKEHEEAEAFAMFDMLLEHPQTFPPVKPKYANPLALHHVEHVVGVKFSQIVSGDEAKIGEAEFEAA